MIAWAVKDWAEVFEDYRSREVDRLQFLHCRVLDRKSEAYAMLVAKDGGVEAYGVFWAIVLIAARCPDRGVLADDKGPMTCSRLAARARMTCAVVDRAITMLSAPDIGWIVECNTDVPPTYHRRTTDETSNFTDGTSKNTDGPPTKPALRTERARDKTTTKTTTATTQGAAAAADGLSADEVKARGAFLRRRPDWLPESKPWIDDDAASELAAMPTLTPEIVTSVYGAAKRAKATLTNPAGYAIKKMREAAKGKK